MQKYRGYLVESFFYLNAVLIIRSYNSSYIIMRAIWKIEKGQKVSLRHYFAYKHIMNK
jgi:hypothetical protein